MNRRRFLDLTAGSLLGAAWPSSVSAASVRTISLIHTTDLHGRILPTTSYNGLAELGGLARCASLIKRWREENPHSLLIDIGDLYQGTHVAWHARGQVMVKLLNALRYDAWVLGNHDFDWGREVLESALAQAAMPVLAANTRFDGAAPGHHEKGSPLARLAPYVLKEVGGFKIGVIGLVTPGLASWLPPQMLREIEALDPLEAARASAAELRRQGAHAVMLAGHMGGASPTFFRDDFANRVSALTKEVPKIDAFLGGHTHRDIPSSKVNGVLYSQAGYYGLYLGRLDLAFDRETGHLLDVRAMTVLMDERFEPDPVVISLVKDELELSETALQQPVGRVREKLLARSTPGQPGVHERLIGQAIVEAMAVREINVDGVFHGAFVETDLEPGEKTLGDIWTLVPYENFIVTAALMKEEIVAVLNEAFAINRSTRQLLGFEVITEAKRSSPRVTELKLANGEPLRPEQRYTIALNSFDAQSGGQRLTRLKEILDTPAALTTWHPVDTRQAVIDFFQRHREISASTLGV